MDGRSLRSPQRTFAAGDRLVTRSKLLRDTLGWDHATTLESAIEQTLEYYRRELPYYL